MPTYHFKDKETGHTFSEFLKISELEEFILKHTHLELQVSAPAVTGTMGKNTPMKTKDKPNAN